MRHLALALFATVCAASDISGIVLDEEGKPVAGTEVMLEIGKARYALTPDYDWWLAVDTKTVTTGADGKFTFADLPDGAVGTASAKGTGTFGFAQGTGPLEVKLGPTGSVKGRLIGKGNDIKQLRVYAIGGMGFGGRDGTIDKRTGGFEIEGLPPGEGRVFIKRGNWDVARHDIEITAGKAATAPNTKVKEGVHLPTLDPEVDVTKTKLVDQQGSAMAGVQLIWSSAWMDGGMDSDNDGVVLLAGGGVAIGGPPYLLRLQTLRSKEGVYEGTMKKKAKGVAIVELHPLAEVRGAITKAGAKIESCRILVVGPGDKPRVYAAQLDGGTYTVHVPRGKCRFVVGTVDGQLREHAFDVQGGSPVAHDIALE